MDEKMTYKDAMAKLEAITSQISSGNIDVDELTEKLKEAKTLLAFCENRLKHVEEDVDKMLEK